MLVAPSSPPPSPARKNGSCRAAGCVVDLNSFCPAELRVVVTSPAASGGGGGVVAACKSACEAFGKEEYCCSGEHGSPATCAATAYSRFFKAACPTAYSYAYDDATSTFTCAGAGGGYHVVFCPAKSSLESSRNPEAVDSPSTYSTMTFTGNAQSLIMKMNSHKSNGLDTPVF
uniref:Thaumatin-like protein n=1 Tax=Leersia perrieri TaxID=77586 RepID=A0A0D9WU66_9ORYZ